MLTSCQSGKMVIVLMWWIMLSIMDNVSIMVRIQVVVSMVGI